MIALNRIDDKEELATRCNSCNSRDSVQQLFELKVSATGNCTHVTVLCGNCVWTLTRDLKRWGFTNA